MIKDTKNTNCDTCAYYDYNDESGEKECIVEFDEDETVRFSYGSRYVCPYYKFYDEYKFVQKQN